MYPAWNLCGMRIVENVDQDSIAGVTMPGIGYSHHCTESAISPRARHRRIWASSNLGELKSSEQAWARRMVSARYPIYTCQQSAALTRSSRPDLIGVAVRQINQMIRIVPVLFSLAIASSAHADEISMTLGVTKSARLSGLLDHILPIFKKASNITVEPVAVDPGQEVAVGDQAVLDAMLFDNQAAADQIVGDKHGVNRLDAIYDDFVIVGPASDPAGIRGLKDAAKALAQIAAKGAPFASRGDDSSTNQRELWLWKSAAVEPGKGTAWYSKVGLGMEPTLALAAAKGAYTLTDRATWANFKDRQKLEILTEGDPACFHVYSTLLGDPEKRPLNKFTYARLWHDWIVNHHGREAIVSYKINGEQIFFQSPQAEKQAPKPAKMADPADQPKLVNPAQQPAEKPAAH
jgi:tungstate transport system substrate-binding protein